MKTLTDWSGAASTVQNSVYLGVWTNWSRGAVMGATLTLNRTQGNLLIAFTAIFIRIVADRLWRIACFTFYRRYSTPEPRDALHHQRQAILRNSNSAASAMWTLLQLVWAWHNMARHTFIRGLPAFLIAALCVFAFTIVGGYSSQISSALKNEVLLNGTHCGAVYLPIATTLDLISIASPYTSRIVADAANYAQQCYTDSPSMFDCTYFVKNNLPSTVDVDAPCPFSDGICRNDMSNIRLDTGYIDSVRDLGVNSPQDESVQFRAVLHCASLETQGYTTDASSPINNVTGTQYHYGPNFGVPLRQDATKIVESLDAQYNRQVANDGKSFILATAASFIYNHVTNNKTSDFFPIPALTRQDGDTLLAFLAGNGIGFYESTDDPWYRGTVPWGSVSTTSMNRTSLVYGPEEAFSPLGCVTQYQFCNPSLPDNSRCGPLASFSDSLLGSATLFNMTREELDNDEIPDQRIGSKFKWLIMQLTYRGRSFRSILLSLGDRALESQKYLANGFIGHLPANQWQLDVSHWFATYLAAMQASFVAGALGLTDPNVIPYTIAPPNKHIKELCNSQKILSTKYVSFSLFGLYFTYITGALIILASYLLEPIFACLCCRRKGGEYTYLEWAATETLQLQRAGYQGIGSGTWSGYNKTIPRTSRREMLGNLTLAYPAPKNDQTSLAGSQSPAEATERTNLRPALSPVESVHRISLDNLLRESRSSAQVSVDLRQSSAAPIPAGESA